MSARRAVKAALAVGDASAERAARDRVGDAKLSLGERGPAWWEPQSEAAHRKRAAAVMRTLLRHRGADKTICPSDVARTVGGERWRASMELVRDEALERADAGALEIRQRGKVVDGRAARGPIRLSLKRS